MKKKFLKKIKKISSLDVLSLFFILFLTASIYLLFSRKTEYLYVTVRLLNQDYPEQNFGHNLPYAWYLEQIKSGKSQKNQLGQTLIEVVDVYSYPSGHKFNQAYVTLKIKAVQNKITKQYLYEGSPLLIHDFKSFKIQDLLINGEVIDINKRERVFKKFKLVLEILPKDDYDYTNLSNSLIKGVKNYIAELLKESLTIKDNQDNELVKVNQIEKMTGERVIATANGVLKIPDLDRTQVFLHVDLLAEEINGYYFFRRIESLLVGEKIWLDFDQVSISGTIISIEEY